MDATRFRATQVVVVSANPYAIAHGLPPVASFRGVLERVDQNREIWRCQHSHQSQDQAIECAQREIRRRPRRRIRALTLGTLALASAGAASYDFQGGYFSGGWFWIVVATLFGLMGLQQAWGTFGYPTANSWRSGCLVVALLLILMYLVVALALSIKDPTSSALIAVTTLGIATFLVLGAKQRPIKFGPNWLLGFRSGVIWRMIVASIFYGVIGLAIALNVSDGRRSPGDRVAAIVVWLLVLGIPVLVGVMTRHRTAS